MRSLGIGILVGVVADLRQPVEAIEITGTVDKVTGEYFTIVSKSEYLPRPGDSVEVYFTIAGLDDRGQVANGVVHEVVGDRITAKVNKLVGTLTKGQSVSIQSARPLHKGGAALETEPRSNSKEGSGSKRGGDTAYIDPPLPSAIHPRQWLAANHSLRRLLLVPPARHRSHPASACWASLHPVWDFSHIAAGPLAADGLVSLESLASRPLGKISNRQQGSLHAPAGRRQPSTRVDGHGLRTSLRMHFGQPVSGVVLTRIGVCGGTSLPKWRLQALDAGGRELDSTGENDFAIDVPVRSFSVKGDGITQLVLTTDNRMSEQEAWATYSGLPLAGITLQWNDPSLPPRTPLDPLDGAVRRPGTRKNGITQRRILTRKRALRYPSDHHATCSRGPRQAGRATPCVRPARGDGVGRPDPHLQPLTGGRVKSNLRDAGTASIAWPHCLFPAAVTNRPLFLLIW